MNKVSPRVTVCEELPGKRNKSKRVNRKGERMCDEVLKGIADQRVTGNEYKSSNKVMESEEK